MSKLKPLLIIAFAATFIVGTCDAHASIRGSNSNYSEAHPIVRRLGALTEISTLTSNVSCTDGICPSNSECVLHDDTFLCECDNGYATVNDDKFCGYERKYQGLAFGLTFLNAIWPVAKFYVKGNAPNIEGFQEALYGLFFFESLLGSMIVWAVVALVLSCPYLIYKCACGKDQKNDKKSSDDDTMTHCMGCIIGCAWLGWFISDLVRFGGNDIPDGNGIALKPW